MRLGTSGFRRRYSPVEGKEFDRLHTGRDSIFLGEQTLSATELEFSNPSLSRRYRAWPIFVVGFGRPSPSTLTPPPPRLRAIYPPPVIVRRTVSAENPMIYGIGISCFEDQS